MKILITNGRVVDPANSIDGIMDILVDGGRIAKVAKNIKSSADEVIDAEGSIVIPGLVDMHVHLREPGREDKETVESGTRAALHGGITSLLAMPNTAPAMDCAQNIEVLKEVCAKSALANVFISGAITAGRKGLALTSFTELKKAGVAALTDDGASVDNEQLMQEALAKAKEENLLLLCHCEDKSLSRSGVVNRGLIATRRGLRGISNESESLRVERDIALAQKSKARLHIMHVSTKESVEVIARAKKAGAQVTAETCPHYFALTDEAVLGYDTNFKMNPPLRSRADREAIIDALKSGVIDCIASDHAPHTENEKDIEFDRAEFGVVGLETLLSVAVMELIDKKIIDWPELVKIISLNPSQILGVDKGTLGVGKDADIVVLDPGAEWTVGKNTLLSKSKNSAFLQKSLKGVIQYTICKGSIAYRVS
jgi:dihydroorotase